MLTKKIKDFLYKGNKRSVKMKKNILLMLFLKGGSILAGLLLIPLTLDYVDSETYGIWMTLSSMVAWIHFFDIGINNGLRNRLTEALANGDFKLGKEYVSTTYAILTFIFIPLMIILLIITPYINWNNLLNLNLKSNLLIPICIIIIYFCLNFIFSTINTIILAEQRPADASWRQLLQQVASLAIIYLLTLTTQGNLVYLCLGLCLAPIIVIVFFNITLFSGRYKKLAPSIKYIKLSLAPNLLKLGIQFFIIQIAGVIQYQMINFLIIRYYGANEVSAYNIAYKYFSVIYMLWGIILAPVWSAVTDAFTRNDIQWIKQTTSKYLKIYFIFILVGIVMLAISNSVYSIWIQNKVSIDFNLSFWILLYLLVLMFSGIYVNVLNGAGKLKIQSIACMFSPIVFLFSFYFFRKLELGVSAILIASIIANFNGLILAPLQYRRLLKK